MYISECVYTCVYARLSKFFVVSRMQNKFNVYLESSWFDFWVFSFLNLLLYQVQPALISTHNWKAKRRICTFPKGNIKCKRSHMDFEVVLLSPFPLTITIIPCITASVYESIYDSRTKEIFGENVYPLALLFQRWHYQNLLKMWPIIQSNYHLSELWFCTGS